MDSALSSRRSAAASGRVLRFLPVSAPVPVVVSSEMEPAEDEEEDEEAAVDEAAIYVSQSDYR
jgi:hypothetical protein